jgi:Sodium/calcium exchanger protein
MGAVPAVAAFLAGAVVSLATSWLLVSRLERVGERLGLSEALLGIVAALAADAPEITAAVSALAGHQQRVGAGRRRARLRACGTTSCAGAAGGGHLCAEDVDQQATDGVAVHCVHQCPPVPPNRSVFTRSGG